MACEIVNSSATKTRNNKPGTKKEYAANVPLIKNGIKRFYYNLRVLVAELLRER